MHEQNQIIYVLRDSNQGLLKFQQQQDFRYPTPDHTPLAELPSQPYGDTQHSYLSNIEPLVDTIEIDMEDNEQCSSTSRKRKANFIHGGKQSRRFHGSITPRKTLSHSSLHSSDFLSFDLDENLQPQTSQASAKPTQALGRLSMNNSSCGYHSGEEHAVSDTATNVSRRSTPERAPSSISTCSSTDAITTTQFSPKQSLSNDLASGSEEYSYFVVHCDLLGFMKRHYGENMLRHTHTLGTVIALSGTIDRAQATTTEDYIRQHWPLTGTVLLEALQSAINSKDLTSQVSSQEVHLDIDLNIPKAAGVRVRGCQQTARDIKCQLEWIGCAFQFSISGKIEYSTVIKDESEPTVMKFQLQRVPEIGASCWLPLFANSVIAYGFPTAHRTNGEKGIEVPFEIMVALAGVRSLVEYEGVTILRGSSCMLVPMKSYYDSIQWHLVSAFGHDTIQGRPQSSNSPGNTKVSVQITEMRTKRAFLGWCEKAEVRLGTRNIDYRTIDYTQSLECRNTQIRISEINVGVNIPAGPIGLSLGAKFEIGTRDHNIHNGRIGTLQDVLRQAEDTPVVLYDPSEKRGWLVPAVGVILHILHTRYYRPAFQRGEHLIDLVHADPDQNGLAAFRIALVESSTASHQRGVSSLDEAVFELWDKLREVRMLQDVDEITSSCIAVVRLARGKEEVRCWEYMDMVDQNHEIRQKRVIIQRSNGGWVKLAREIHCPVIIASGLKDIIKPMSGSQYCRSWTSLPTGKDYLAASTTVLQGLFIRAGSSSDYRYLTTTQARIQWLSPRGSDPFGVCKSPCHCNPLQQLKQHSVLTGPISHPTRLAMAGAVIFGCPANFIQRSHQHPLSHIYVGPPVDITTGIPNEVVSSQRSAFGEVFDKRPHISESASETTPVSCGGSPISFITHGISQKGAPNLPPNRSLTGDTLCDIAPVPDSRSTDRHISLGGNMTGDTLRTPTAQNSEVIDLPMSPEGNSMDDVQGISLAHESKTSNPQVLCIRNALGDISNKTSSVQKMKVVERRTSPNHDPTATGLAETPSPEAQVMIGRPPSPASKFMGGYIDLSSDKTR